MTAIDPKYAQYAIPPMKPSDVEKKAKDFYSESRKLVRDAMKHFSQSPPNNTEIPDVLSEKTVNLYKRFAQLKASYYWIEEPGVHVDLNRKLQILEGCPLLGTTAGEVKGLRVHVNTLKKTIDAWYKAISSYYKSYDIDRPATLHHDIGLHDTVKEDEKSEEKATALAALAKLSNE